MSDAAVARAVKEAIANHESAIRQTIALQGHIVDMMLQPGNSGDALYALTSRYKEHDRTIGEHRTSIRNLTVSIAAD